MGAQTRTGRTVAIVALCITFFVLGLAAGHYLSRQEATGGGHAADHGAGAGLYTCGMHPNVIEESPGICPICNMDLTPVRGSESAGAPAEEASAVIIDPAVMQNIGVRTAKVARGPLARTIRATGEIVEDETKVGIVNLKIAGWIERIFADETGQAVRKGDPLVEIYSPRLVTTQEEYLIARKNLERVRGGGATEVVDAAERTLESTRRRLLYWDITEDQIAELDRTGEVSKIMVLRSPFSGVVTMKHALPGQKVAPGTDLYYITDLDAVWVKASVYDADLPFIELGQDATMTLSFLPGREFSGRITFISPVLDPKTRDIKVRMEFPNAGGELKPGMYADVAIRSLLEEDAVLLPREAVIRSGRRNVVFVARGEGRFVPTDVRLGPQGEDGVLQALGGVAPGEEVVTSAQFLLDSESSFQEALRKMMDEKSAKPAREEERPAGGRETPARETTIAAAEGSRQAEDVAPFLNALFEGEPVANAVSVEPDGGITILCPVMKGERVIEAGDVYTMHEGMRVYYCCPGCKSDFESDPGRYLAELDEVLRGRTRG